MNFFKAVARNLFPKLYIRVSINKAKRDYFKRKEMASKSGEPVEICNYDLWELEEWMQSIKDKELIKRAEKMDIYLDEIPYLEYDPEDPHSIKSSHFYYSQWGDKLLGSEVRKKLIKSIRDKRPTYRKEKREVIELWVKCGGVLIGILGALTGLVAILSKSEGCL